MLVEPKTDSNSFQGMDEPDYTRHKLERAHRRELDRAGLTGEVDLSGQEDEPGRPGTAGNSSTKSSSQSSPTQHRPKSILKQPTVRFKDDDDANSDSAAPFRLPPPPGPDGKPLLVSRPLLHKNMPPLPPGQPMGLNPFVPGIVGSNGVPKIDPVAYKLYERFMDELSDFVAMQGNVVRSRVEVQERRTRLRLYRENVSKKDIDFMDYLRECKATGTVSENPKLEQLFEAAQQARDLVGPEEVEYEELEIKLGADESALELKYDDLESRFERFFKLGPTASTENTIPSTIQFEQPSDITGTDDQHAHDEEEPRQYSRFQGALIGDKVKVGQLPIVGTGSDDGKSAGEHPIQTEEEPSPGAHHTSNANNVIHPGTSGGSDIAANTAGMEVPEKFQADLGSVQFDEPPTAPDFLSGEVRMSFSLQGLDPSPFRKTTVHFVDDPDLDLPPYETTEGFLHGVYLPPIEEIPERLLDNLSVSFHDSFGDADSLLLLGTDSDTQSTLSEYLMSFESTRDRVNKWLLHKLRVSPLEVLELQRQVHNSPHTVPDWANLALKLWDGDIFDYKKRKDTSPAPYPSTEELPRRLRLPHRRRWLPVQADDVLGS